MNKESSGCYVIDPEYNIVNMNAVAKSLYPQLKVGHKCYTCLMGLDEPCPPCPVKNGVKGPTTYTDPIRNISEVVDAVDIEIPGKGLCHALVFATVEKEAVFAATLPTNAEELKTLALVKGLTVDYYDVFSVDLTTGNMTMYRHNGKAIGSDSGYKEIESYAHGMENYIDKHVYSEDREALRHQTTLEYIRETLTKNESMVLHYRVIWQEQIHHFYRKIVRIGDADSFENIVVGIGCEDDAVQQHQQQMILQDNLRRVEYDAATGLLTKAAFFIHSNALLKNQPGRKFDLCLMRVENMGPINYQYGNIAGGKLVQLIGTILKTYENELSCITYLGEGVFGSLTENTDDSIRQANIRQFRDKITADSDIKNLVLRWTIYKSIDTELSVEEAYEKLAYTLSTIRPTMHSEYVEFDQAMIDQLDWNRSVEDNFKTALAQGQFEAWFQPKYSVHTQQIIGAEALARWRLPDGQMVPPGKFIPVLENCGLINLLDEEIFRQVCRFKQFLSQSGYPDIPISVNLSRASIFTNDISANYASIAQSYGVPFSGMPIEITESAAVRARMIGQFADSLIQKGFVLHMDDFGSGYSSLASLQIIPFESIKLDKTLVDFIGKRSGESLLKHTIAYAKENGLNVVAEGVETLEQFMFLKVAGCDAIQGYYFSGPIPKDELLKRLK